MSAFPRYDRYKDSGVEWLGEIPEHWELLPFQGLFDMSREKNEDEIVGEMLSISGLRGVETKQYESDSQKRTKEQLADYRVVRKGQLAVNTMWLNYAGLGVSDLEGHMSPAYRAYDIRPKLEGRYAHHLLRSFGYVQAYTGLMQGIRPNSLQIKNDDFKKIPILVPPKPEQDRIVTFLDRKTAEIDALIAKKQRQIELLDEQKAILINRAVTRGLNPNAKLKPSGIEWIGEIPEGWEAVALKYLVSHPIIDGPHESPEKLSEGIPFVSAEAISKGYIDFDKKWGYISAKDHAKYSLRYKPKRGDLLLVKLGATTGVPAIVETDMDFNIWVPLAAIRPNVRVEPRFLYHVLGSKTLRRAYELNWTYGTQQTLGLGTISNLRIPLPERTEQVKIAHHLDSIAESFDGIRTKEERAIESFQLLRRTLIAHAVTGRIKVPQ